MNVSNITSVVNTQPGNGPDGIADFAKDSKALESALQSGDLAGAQNAFATLQHDVRVTALGGSQPFGQNSAAGKDFQALETALRAGSLTGARSAFASFKQDLQGPRAELPLHSGKAHAHRGHRAAAPQPPAGTLDVTA
jgi:hypothetical protein